MDREFEGAKNGLKLLTRLSKFEEVEIRGRNKFGVGMGGNLFGLLSKCRKNVVLIFWGA